MPHFSYHLQLTQSVLCSWKHRLFAFSCQTWALFTQWEISGFKRKEEDFTHLFIHVIIVQLGAFILALLYMTCDVLKGEHTSLWCMVVYTLGSFFMLILHHCSHWQPVYKWHMCGTEHHSFTIALLFVTGQGRKLKKKKNLQSFLWKESSNLCVSSEQPPLWVPNSLMCVPGCTQHSYDNHWKTVL